MQTVSAEAAGAGTEAAPVPALQTANLRKVYGRTVALQDLSLRVEQGEVFGFLGPNGAGKTTTVKVLMGLVRPTAGEAWILGRPVQEPEARRRAGYLPENFRYHDWLTGEALLDFHGRLAGMSAAERRRRIPEAVARVGLAGREGDRIRGYSKGMTQRIGIAVAILHRPDVILLDEPTSALDPVGRREVRDLIRSLRAEGMTVFINSHLLSEVEMVCDRVAVVARGRVVRGGPLTELLGAAVLRLTVDRVDDELLRLLERIAVVAEVAEGSVTLEAEPEAAPLVAEAVVGAGYRLFALVPVHRSLEEVFLQLVEGGEA